MKIGNIFKEIPFSLPNELLEEIDSNDNVKIERIISDGHSSIENFWYDQEKNELVFYYRAVLLLNIKVKKN